MHLSLATPELFATARRFIGALQMDAYPKEVKTVLLSASEGDAFGGKNMGDSLATFETGPGIL